MRLASCCSLARFKRRCTRKGPRDDTATAEHFKFYAKHCAYLPKNRMVIPGRSTEAPLSIKEFGPNLTHRLGVLPGTPPTPGPQSSHRREQQIICGTGGRVA
jgi:hypothetical protein